MDNRYYYRVQPRDTDFTLKVSLPALGDYLLQAAGENADRMGFGVRELQGRGWTWVLSRLSVEMERLPGRYEDFSVETWVEDAGRLTTTRHFVVYDAGNRPIGGACTLWAMIDIGTRAPVDLSAHLAYKDHIDPRPGRIGRPLKLRGAGGEPVLVHEVRYGDIDFNQHANSMRYLQWMLDTLPLDRFRDFFPARADLNFVHEALYGQRIGVHLEDAGTVSLLELKRPDGESVCKGRLDWKAL